MDLNRLPFEETLRNLPPDWPEDPLPAIREYFQAARAKLVIIDDDPTGNQTVFNIPLLTEWPVAALQAELENDLPAFFILTNARSLPPPRPRRLPLRLG